MEHHHRTLVVGTGAEGSDIQIGGSGCTSWGMPDGHYEMNAGMACSTEAWRMGGGEGFEVERRVLVGLMI